MIPTRDLSLEFLIPYELFERSNMIRRTSDLNKREALSNSHMILPKNAMIHLIDNISHFEHSTDTFGLEDYPFLNTKNTLKYLHNFIDFAAIKPSELETFAHRIYRRKLAETLKTFTMANRKVMIPTLNLDTVVSNKNCVIIENYNPLYRILATSNRPISQYNRYHAFMSTILANVANYNRQHILVMSIPDMFEYNRSNLIGIVQAGEITSPRLLSSNHFYFFIIDLVALLLDNNSKLSVFNTIDRRVLSALNVMLVYKQKSIIFNIGKLATLAKSKTYIFSFINHISRLSGVNIPIIPIADDEVDPGETEDSAEQDDLTLNQPQVGSLANNLVQNIAPITPSILVEKVADKLSKTDTSVSVQIPVPDHKIFETPAPKEADIIVPILTKAEVEKPKFEPIVPTVATTPLSLKQQERIEILSSKYKAIEVPSAKGPQTIEKILNDHVDISLPPVAFNVENHSSIDPEMLKTTTLAFDKHYQEKLLRKDILMSVVAFKENGLFLTDYKETNDYSSFTRIKHVKASFHDIRGKKHTVNFKLPMPDSDGYYLVNGVRLSMSKQLVNIPICKISPTRVSLISNYNKTLVDKVQSVRHSLPEYLATKAADLGLKLIPKHNTYIGVKAPCDYKQLGSKYAKISTDTYRFYFEYEDRYTFFDQKSDQHISSFSSLEEKHGVLVGQKRNTTEYVFMSQNNMCTTVDIESNNITESNKPIVEYFGSINIPSEWCNLKILDKNLPIIFILAYRYGLSSVLSNLKIKYRFISKSDKEKIVRKSTEIRIQLADGSLLFDRYPLEHSYLLAGLSFFTTLTNYNLHEFDDKDVYYQLLSDKGMSTNYLKGIDAYFSFFIDPITKEILHEMGEPTNTKDLLIRAVNMLVDSTDKAPSAISNFRLRSAEKIPAMIYNEIARQYANYINSNFKDVSFSINTEAIFQRILQDETMTLREDLNPIHAIKETSKVTYTGFGGRSSEAFVTRDRKYPKDAIGVLGETTTDSGSVGMVSALTGDPKIKNLRGMFEAEAPNLNTVNKLSDTSLLIPGSTHDDPKRANLCSVQMSHHIPTPNMMPSRMCTGYEQIIPHKTSSIFVGKAKHDGKVISIDKNLNIVTVMYRDKTTDIFEYGNIVGEASGQAVNHKLAITPGLHPGSLVKTGDIIVYHEEFFHFDPITRQLSWCYGIPATIAIMAKDVTLEDSCMLSSDFAEKMKFDSIYTRPIQISTDMVVDSFADVGTKVGYNDSLIRLKYEDTLNIIGEVDELFDDLKQVEYRSKHDGTIVGIKVYYVAENLNASLLKFISKVTYRARRKANVAKGTHKEEQFSSVNRVPDGVRISGVQLSEADILIEFTISSSIACGIGDKMVCGPSLKSVIGRVEDKPMLTEHGATIDVVFSANSVFNRIVLSPIIQGISDQILEEGEHNIIDMYFNNE